MQAASTKYGDIAGFLLERTPVFQHKPYASGIQVRRLWMLGCWLGLFVSQVGTAEQVMPWPDFRDGMRHWQSYSNPSGGFVEWAALSGGDVAPGAVRADTRLMLGGEAGFLSEPFPITPLVTYQLRAMVKRIRGDYAFKLTIEWLGANREHLGYFGGWSGLLIGQDWEPCIREVISPEAARFARIIAGVSGNQVERNVCLMTQFTLATIAPAGERLSIDLLHDPVPLTGSQNSGLTVRLENRGNQPLENIRATISLPEGMSSGDPLDFTVQRLSYDQENISGLQLEGSPADSENALIRCSVSALAGGQTRHFEQTTRPFVTQTVQITKDAASLPAPVIPAMKIKLGAYYFPVMLDWNRDGWGVSKVPHLKPRLGYYNEALPEVADWHIHWAASHGISFFVFDWYWNQGMDFLNDALDKGFLKSRFRDQMEFAVHWCNFWQPEEYHPFNYSNEALEKFIRTLCERYFIQPNYLHVHGKPAVYILNPIKIANAQGGWNAARQAMDRMRSIARSYGHSGVYFIAVMDHPYLPDFSAGGFDAVTAYTFMFRDVPMAPDRSYSYQALLPQYHEGFAEAQSRAHAQGIEYIPTGWAGWDDNPREKDNAVRTVENTPAAVHRMAEMLPDFVEPSTRLAHIEAWNEWGEGTALEPGGSYGFGYLNAVLDALGTAGARGSHQVFVPTQGNYNSYQTSATSKEIQNDYYSRYAKQIRLNLGFKMDFNSGAGLWMRRDGSMRDVHIANGSLHGESIGISPHSTYSAPAFAGPPIMDLDGGKVSRLRLRMSATAGEKARLYFTTPNFPVQSETRSFSFNIQADGQMHEYVIEAGSDFTWSRSRITQIILMPTDQAALIELDYLQTEPFQGQFSGALHSGLYR